jgi:hypothetical protein
MLQKRALASNNVNADNNDYVKLKGPYLRSPHIVKARVSI